MGPASISISARQLQRSHLVSVSSKLFHHFPFHFITISIKYYRPDAQLIGFCTGYFPANSGGFRRMGPTKFFECAERVSQAQPTILGRFECNRYVASYPDLT